MVRYNGIELTVGTRLPGLLPSTWFREDVRIMTGEWTWKGNHHLIQAVVEHIHPLGRLVVIRFEMPGGCFREAYVVRNGVMFP